MTDKLSSPAAAGYRMPAEWEPHESTWISWPHNPETWPDQLAHVEQIFARAVQALAPYETVRINVLDEAHADHVRALIAAHGPLDNVVLHVIPTNDAWVRDHGAIFLVQEDATGRRIAATNWGYNSWGGKYPPWDLDDAVPPQMADALGVPCFDRDIILEGGSVEVNGAGVLLTTEACLLNPNRNPHLGREEIEVMLRDGLGVEHVLWLGDGIVGDDTDGHVDDVTRFVDETTVVTAVEDDPADDNYEPLRENLERLRAMTLPDGRPLRIVTLPMPRPVYTKGERMPASYANFYVANGVVLMPAYEDAADEKAARVLQDCFPDRKIVSLDCRDVIWGLGAFHCLTQQVPAR